MAFLLKDQVNPEPFLNNKFPTNNNNKVWRTPFDITFYEYSGFYFYRYGKSYDHLIENIGIKKKDIENKNNVKENIENKDSFDKDIENKDIENKDFFDKDFYTNSDGFILPNDIITSINFLENNPDYLKNTSPSMKIIEQVTGEKAYLKNNNFGVFHLKKEGKYSLFNNPLNLSMHSTNAENNFEILFFRKDYQSGQSVQSGQSLDPLDHLEPLQFVGLERILDLIKDY